MFGGAPFASAPYASPFGLFIVPGPPPVYPVTDDDVVLTFQSDDAPALTFQTDDDLALAGVTDDDVDLE